jgi:hypothetical protein
VNQVLEGAGQPSAPKSVLATPSQTPNQASSSLGLVVLAEDTHKTLLAHRICTDDDIYHRQGAVAGCRGALPDLGERAKSKRPRSLAPRGPR